MNRTRLSLYYLATYLVVIGLALLFLPRTTLLLLRASGVHGEAFPRFAGMLMAGLGLNIAGIIRARAEALYPATLLVRSFFLACLGWFYWTTRDPFFLVITGIVAVGVSLTFVCYVTDRAQIA